MSEMSCPGLLEHGGVLDLRVRAATPDTSARALGCAVIRPVPANTDAQFELIEAYRPGRYSGTPDFPQNPARRGVDRRRDVSSIKRALVSGAAFPNRCRTR